MANLSSGAIPMNPKITAQQAMHIINTMPGLTPAERKQIFSRWEAGDPGVVDDVARRMKLRHAFVYQKMRGLL